MGINAFGKIPAEVAAFLQLSNPRRYTENSFGRSSATFLVDSGDGITNIKLPVGRKSTSVAKGYLEGSEKE